MKKKMLILSATIALLSGLAFEAFAIGCPKECVTKEDESPSGYCIDDPTSEGDMICVAFGVGPKNCTGDATPENCTPE